MLKLYFPFWIWNVRLILIIAPAVLEGDVNILKLFVASVPWFMKQCVQCLQTTRKSAGWRNAVRTTHTVRTHMQSGHTCSVSTTENVLTHAVPHISIDDILMAALPCSTSVLQRACISFSDREWRSCFTVRLLQSRQPQPAQ